MIDRDLMFEIGLNLSQKISDKIRTLSLEKALGKEIGRIGYGGDFTKFADDESEKVVIKEIEIFSKKFPEYKIILISEETGLLFFGNENSKDGFFIILDPLDGSNNLRRWKTPSPFVSTSLAMGSLKVLQEKNNFDAIEIGIVQDVFNNRIYYAKKDCGAFVEKFGKINSSPLVEIEKSIIGIDFDMKGGELEEKIYSLLPLLKEKNCQRRLGSSVLDIAKVACGEYDAVVSILGGLKIHDVAAVQLLVKESGGECHLFHSTLEKCLIKKIIEKKDNSLIKSHTFKMVASGNIDLQKKIINKLKLKK